MKISKADNNIGEQAKGGVACRIANEFQTSLGIIITAGEVLESYFERLSPDRRRLALKDILCAAREMNHTIDLLAASDQKNSQPKGRVRAREVRRNREAARFGT